MLSSFLKMVLCWVKNIISPTYLTFSSKWLLKLDLRIFPHFYYISLKSHNRFFIRGPFSIFICLGATVKEKKCVPRIEPTESTMGINFSMLYFWCSGWLVGFRFKSNCPLVGPGTIGLTFGFSASKLWSTQRSLSHTPDKRNGKYHLTYFPIYTLEEFSETLRMAIRNISGFYKF